MEQKKAKTKTFLKEENQAVCKKFAMWFIVNWEWHDDTEKGETYISTYDGKSIMNIHEIFESWLISEM